jgi:mannose-6-phosphate isomerase
MALWPGDRGTNVPEVVSPSGPADAAVVWHRDGMDKLLELPLRLSPNRVYRFYRGGAQIDAFRGAPDPTDGEFPEDWVGSVTPAINPAEHTRDGEGLSTVEVDGRTWSLAELLARSPELVAGREIVARYGPTTALLVKLLDAGSRLPVHGHPSREFARHILHSQFGKAEAWVVLATRQIPGQLSPRVWLGFREEVARDQLAEWIERQDTDAIRAAMNEFEVRPGDAVFVRPGLPHATGAGVFLIEAQEPTDFSVVAEYRGYPIAPDEAHLGLGWDTMLDCFDRSAVTGPALAALSPRPTRIAGSESAGWTEDDLLGKQSHAFFRATRLSVRGAASWPHAGIYAVVIVTGGQGVARTAHGEVQLKRGDTLAILAGTAETTISGDLELVAAMPSFD